MAAIVDFEKVAEDDETVTYRYGFDYHFDHSMTIGKADRRPRTDEADFRWPASLALTGILRVYRERGHWPERGAGVT